MSLPDRQLAEALFQWTRGARNRLLRLADLPQRRDILELGCGWGFLADELAHRAPAARVVAIDREPAAIRELAGRCPRVTGVVADVHELPPGLGTFDLIIAHFSFLWFRDPARVLAECRRVLRRRGVVLAIEPDYGGLMEDPDTGRRERWMEQLAAHGADPCIGRKLPALLRRQGLNPQILFCDRYVPPDPRADRFLDALQAGPASRSPMSADATIFLPLWLAIACGQ